ncbi:choice-of-anchor G family protein, partial [Clavibacter sp. Sh2141]|uniref:choice-of-anchor G family protein n=1 Tax=Clavibacter sp. Sh2141 TaxID=3395374 RepID=UPI0039BCE5D1
MALHLPRRRSSLATATAFGLTAALVAFGGTMPANAAPGDTAEAEGRLLTIGALAPIVDTPGAYTGFRPGETPDPQVLDGALAASVLQGLVDVEVGAGVDLGQVLDLDGAVRAGAVDQYASSGSAGATAGAGALGQDGAIALNGGEGALTTLDLAPTLASLGLGTTLSDLDLRFGALSSSATDPGAGPTTSSYRIASAEGTITSPLVGNITAELREALAGLEPAIEADVDLTAATGPLLDGVLGQIPLVAGLDVGTVTTSVDATVDTEAIIAAIVAQPLTSGAVSINLTAGTITVDLDRIQDLNGLGANTRILTGDVISDAVDLAITDILTNVLPNRLVETVLNSTDVSIAVDAPLTTTVPLTGVVLNAGTLGIDVSTTLGGLISGPAGALTVDPSRTTLATLPVGQLLAPLTTLLTQQLVPALISTNADLPVLTGIAETLTTATDDIIGVLDPIFPVVDQVVRLTANAQDTPGGFADAAGTDAGSFTVSALRVGLLPTAGGPVVDLASATVRAGIAAVVDITITSPAPGQVFSAGTATVPVRGLAIPGSNVSVSLTGGSTQTQTAVADATTGAYTVQFAGLPSGSFTATATQSVDGVVTGPTASVQFSIAEPAADVADTDVDVLDLDGGLDVLDTDAADLDVLDADVIDIVDGLD